MDLHLRFLKHPKNATNLLKPSGNNHITHEYIQVFSAIYLKNS